MESMTARLMILVKAVKYQNLCTLSIARAQSIMNEGDALNDIKEYRELCYETEKAKLYNEFSDELRELADSIGTLCGEDKEDAGDS